MASFTWLHLSDFHLTNPLNFNRDMLFKQLLREIEAQCTGSLQPDVVFFTGDIAYSGNDKQYDLAQSKFDAILQACGLTGRRDRLFVVPGNHDVDRSVIPSFCKFIRKKILEKVWENYQQIDDALSDKNMRAHFFSRFRNYEHFLQEYFGTSMKGILHPDQSSYYYTTSIKLTDDTEIAIVALNSAWMSEEDNEQGRLFLGRRQVYEALEGSKQKFPGACLRIVLVHHPLYWLAEEDMAKVEPILAQSCSVLLHGHLHCTRLGVHSNPDVLLRVMAAGATFEARSNMNAYNIVQLNLKSGGGTAKLRIQQPDYSPNWGNDGLTYRNAKNGKLSLKVKLS